MKHSSYLHPTTKNILFQKRIINYISVIPKKTHTLPRDSSVEIPLYIYHW